MFVGVWNSICCIIVKKNNKWKDKCLQSSADLSLNELLKESGKLVIQTDLVVCPSVFWKTNRFFFFFSAFFLSLSNWVKFTLRLFVTKLCWISLKISSPSLYYTYTHPHIFTYAHIPSNGITTNNELDKWEEHCESILVLWCVILSCGWLYSSQRSTKSLASLQPAATKAAEVELHQCLKKDLPELCRLSVQS